MLCNIALRKQVRIGILLTLFFRF